MRDLTRHRDDEGAVVVEFAIVFVLFALLLSGLIQYGVIFAAEQSLAHAASEATRAVVNITDANEDGSTEDDASSRIDEVLGDQMQWMDGAIDPSDGGKVDYQVAFTGCPECVEVTVTYNWADDPLVPQILPIGTPARLSSSANVRYR